MDSAVGTLFSLAPLALLGAVVSVPVYYLVYRRAPEPKRPVSALGYVLVAFATGVGGYLAGTVLGIVVACSGGGAGNLCGLAGVFGAGPLVGGAAVVAYAHAWSRRARRAP
jgi:hypothetical protein